MAETTMLAGLALTNLMAKGLRIAAIVSLCVATSCRGKGASHVI